MQEVLSVLAEDGPFALIAGFLIWWVASRQEKLLTNMSKQIGISNLLLVGLQKQLLMHDLTVTGLNPSTGEDFDERDSRAFVKYTEVLSVFDAIEEQIKKI